ncbi:hypothetical protein FOA52_015421 [Chlamydomonas sp. UWO 241]|nr:hypothetical protein FOA52_015421 [Chlamydomonas sp. UWO 241]
MPAEAGYAALHGRGSSSPGRQQLRSYAGLHAAGSPGSSWRHTSSPTRESSDPMHHLPLQHQQQQQQRRPASAGGALAKLEARLAALQARNQSAGGGGSGSGGVHGRPRPVAGSSPSSVRGGSFGGYASLDPRVPTQQHTPGGAGGGRRTSADAATHERAHAPSVLSPLHRYMTLATPSHPGGVNGVDGAPARRGVAARPGGGRAVGGGELEASTVWAVLTPPPPQRGAAAAGAAAGAGERVQQQQQQPQGWKEQPQLQSGAAAAAAAVAGERVQQLQQQHRGTATAAGSAAGAGVCVQQQQRGHGQLEQQQQLKPQHQQGQQEQLGLKQAEQEQLQQLEDLETLEAQQAQEQRQEQQQQAQQAHAQQQEQQQQVQRQQATRRARSGSPPAAAPATHRAPEPRPSASGGGVAARGSPGDGGGSGYGGVGDNCYSQGSDAGSERLWRLAQEWQNPPEQENWRTSTTYSRLMAMHPALSPPRACGRSPATARVRARSWEEEDDEKGKWGASPRRTGKAVQGLEGRSLARARSFDEVTEGWAARARSPPWARASGSPQRGRGGDVSRWRRWGVGGGARADAVRREKVARAGATSLPQSPSPRVHTPDSPTASEEPASDNWHALGADSRRGPTRSGGEAGGGWRAGGDAASNRALLGVVGRAEAEAVGLRARVEELELALRMQQAQAEVRDAGLRLAASEQARLTAKLAADRPLAEVFQVYEDDMARLAKDVAAARAGETSSATDAASARLQLATALRREEGARAAACPPSGASHVVLLKAAAESSDRSARALADLKQQLKKIEARAASAEEALEGERRRGRALLLRAKQADLHLSRLRTLEKSDAGRDAAVERARLAAADANGRADRADIEVARLRAENEVLRLQNANLLSWRDHQVRAMGAAPAGPTVAGEGSDSDGGGNRDHGNGDSRGRGSSPGPRFGAGQQQRQQRQRASSVGRERGAGLGAGSGNGRGGSGGRGAPPRHDHHPQPQRVGSPAARAALAAVGAGSRKASGTLRQRWLQARVRQGGGVGGSGGAGDGDSGSGSGVRAALRCSLDSIIGELGGGGVK